MFSRFKDIYRKKGGLIKWLKVVRPAWGRSGLLKADGFLHYLLEEIRVDTFEELKIPFHVMAADFYRGEPVIFNTGELLPAIRASMSIPGIFVPVEHNGKILVGIRTLDFDKIKTVFEQTQPAMEELKTKLEQVLNTKSVEISR